GYPLERVRLKLGPSGEQMPSRASLANLTALSEWAETATTAQLAALRGARSGQQVLVVGENVPLLEGDERFWGSGVFVPLGRRLDPALTEADLRALLGGVKD